MYMGLAELCGKVATHQELVKLLSELEDDNIRLREALEDIARIAEKGDVNIQPLLLPIR